MARFSIFTITVLGLLVSFFGRSEAQALKSTDLDLFEYEVRFTNPDCPTYRYDGFVESHSGDRLTEKPKTYCRQKDGSRAARADHSPIKKVLSWVNSAKTKDITVLTFSLSNRSFINAICRAQNRDVKVTVVMDEGTDPARSASTKEQLEKCENSRGEGITVHIRGNQRGLGIHHNKLLVINMNEKSMPLQLAYGSGNFSSGLVLHHENWSFVTVQKNSYFAQNHVCLVDGVIDHGQSKDDFRNFIYDCKRRISFEKETDITLYIAPIEGRESMNQITSAIERAHSVDVAAHRFSNRTLINALKDFAGEEGPDKVRLFFDDDMFWAAKDGRGFGNQDSNEARIQRDFQGLGIYPHYAQTEDREHLLHHNKFVLTRDSDGTPRALHTGAGNLTISAFNRNFENFYFITRPDVLEAFAKQYDYLYSEVGTSGKDMPTDREPSFR